MQLYPQSDRAESPADAVRFEAHRDCLALKTRSGHVLIEGLVLQAGGREGPAALEVLVGMIDGDGPEALAKVEGDFVALIVDRDGLHAFKSFTSQYQIYYDATSCVLSNRLFDLFQSGASAWDEDYFARHVCAVPGYQFLSRNTPLKCVSRVLPGELVSFTPELTHKQLVRRQYAYLLDSSQRNEDVSLRILDILRQSIRQRLAASPERKICVEISGGLDSSFIACLLGERVPSGIRGVMFSQPNVPSHAISEGYARAVADRYGIDLVVVGPDDLPCDVHQYPGYSDEPSDFFWFGDMFSRSVASQAGENAFVFTGFGADQLFLRSPSFLPWLLQQREFSLFAKALGPASELMSRGRFNLLRQSALTLVPERPYRRINGWLTRRRLSFMDVSDVSFQRVLGGHIPWVRCGQQIEYYTQEKDEWERQLVGDGVICDDWGYFSAPRTVTQGHFEPRRLTDASPFCDLPLMDFVYEKVSATLVHHFDGRYKELLRECQKGIVPESLRDRKNDTFVFNSFQLKYFNDAQEYFRSLIDAAPDEWVNRKGARLAFEQLLFGMTSSSTRALTALIGYLRWRNAFVEHSARNRQKKQSGRMFAHYKSI